jgi:transcriptional regulator with XRE-family HTH domain
VAGRRSTSKSASKTTSKAKTPRRASRRSKTKTEADAKKVADAASKAAKEAGATGKRLTAAKQQLRDSAIVARKAQGLTAPMIAAEFGITTRTVERVLADRRSVRSPLDDSPMQLLEELAVGFRLAIGDYEAMAVSWFDTNQAASLGAKKAADETRARLASLLADVGKLPTNLELFRSEMEMQRIAEEMVNVMRAVAAGEMDVSEAVEFFRGLLRERAQAQLPEAAA